VRVAVVSGKGLHSSIIQLNLSRFCHRYHPAYPSKVLKLS
jgi:hypothetical protein